LDIALLTHKTLTKVSETDTAQQLLLSGIIGAFNRAGLYHTLLDDYLLPSLALTHPSKILAETQGQIGKQYHHIGQYKTASEYLKKSLAIQQDIGDKAGEGTTLNNISAIFNAKGDYNTALEYLKKSLAIQQDIGDKAGEGTTLNNISAIFNAKGDYNTALEYLKKSLAIQQDIGDKAGLCATLFNMGHIHAQDNDMQKAAEAWITVYVIAKEVGEAQALQALENLAPQLGLDGGLAGWDKLANQIQANTLPEEGL
jgi:tetratricopeptide (TPR) repeat protein